MSWNNLVRRLLPRSRLILGCLRGIPFTHKIDDAQLRPLSAVSERYHIPPGSVLFHMGRPATRVYIVEAGRIRMYRNQDDPGTHFGPGSILCADTILADAPQSHFAETVEMSTLIVIERPAFERLIADYPMVEAQMIPSRTCQGRH